MTAIHLCLLRVTARIFAALSQCFYCSYSSVRELSKTQVCANLVTLISSNGFIRSHALDLFITRNLAALNLNQNVNKAVFLLPSY